MLLTSASRAIYVNMHTWSYVQGREGGGEEGEGEGGGIEQGAEQRERGTEMVSEVSASYHFYRTWHNYNNNTECVCL